jgi:hypothetical protein
MVVGYDALVVVAYVGGLLVGLAWRRNQYRLDGSGEWAGVLGRT